MRLLVVGAGLSGLVAANEIQQAGHDVVVIEARDRVGGRVFTLRDGMTDGQFADVGAEIIYHGQHGIVELCKRFGVELAVGRGRVGSALTLTAVTAGATWERNDATSGRGPDHRRRSGRL